MWRKKVDNSLFAHKTTLIPIAYVKQWKLKQYFPRKKEFVSINFQKKEYEGYITATQPKDRPNEAHRLWISTTNKWGGGALETIRNQNPRVSRINLSNLQESPVHWEKLDKGITGEP